MSQDIGDFGTGWLFLAAVSIALALVGLMDVTR